MEEHIAIFVEKTDNNSVFFFVKRKMLICYASESEFHRKKFYFVLCMIFQGRRLIASLMHDWSGACPTAKVKPFSLEKLFFWIIFLILHFERDKNIFTGKKDAFGLWRCSRI